MPQSKDQSRHLTRVLAHGATLATLLWLSPQAMAIDAEASASTTASIAADEHDDADSAIARKGKAKLAAEAAETRTGHGGGGGKAKKNKDHDAEQSDESAAADDGHAEAAAEEPAPAEEQAAAEPAATEEQAAAEPAPSDEHAAAEHGTSDQAEAAPAAGDCVVKAAEESSHSADPHWTYEGEAGPDHWAELSPKFEMCGIGARQTPIDLSAKDVVPMGLEDVQFNYSAVAGKVVNNGHTIQVNLEAGNSIVVDGATYNLAQFHFHTPSEHTIDGGSYPMELHLVHKDEKGNLAVVGIMLEKGEKNPVLSQVWSKMPKAEGKPVALKEPLDMNALLPTDRSAYRYLGSLTTPPCSEGVKWIVMKSSMAITTKQLAGFKKIFPMNARPLQPINARSIVEDTTTESTHASQ
jgi:carbonic anhydrase